MTNFDEKAATWDQNPQTIERGQAIAAGIRRMVPLSTEMSGFEYGCGTGVLSFLLSPSLRHITMADSSEGMLEVLQDKIRTTEVVNMTPMRLDLTADPVPPEMSFELVYSAMTLHHIADTDRILQIFDTMLKPDGYLCISDLDKEDGTFHSGTFDGHHGFDRRDLQTRLERAGFRDVGFETCYTISKERNDVTDDFPVFLMTCRKPVETGNQ